MRCIAKRFSPLSLLLVLVIGNASFSEEPKEDDQLKLNQIDPQLGPIAKSSRWLGRFVEQDRGQVLGQVEDLAMDLVEGCLALVVIRPMDASKSRLYVPPTVLQEQGEDRLVLTTGDVDLAKAPRLSANVNAKQVTRLWAAGVYEFFGKEPHWNQRKLSGTWGTDNKLGQLYDPKRAQTVTGEIESIDNLSPLPGMAVGAQLTLKTPGESFVVLTAPLGFLSKQKIAFQKGDKITVTGSKVTLGEREILAAATIRQGEATIEFRGAKGGLGWGWTDQDDAYGFELLTSLIGKPVRNLRGDELGRIEDFAITPQNGAIAYAAMSCSCFPDSSGKLFPIPLGAFVVEPNAKVWKLELPEDVLEKTPTFAQNNWPDQLDRGWIEYIHVRYGRSARSGVRTALHGKSQF